MSWVNDPYEYDELQTKLAEQERRAEIEERFAEMPVEKPEWVVVIVENGHCTFASSLATRSQCEELVRQLGEGWIVPAEEGRMWKRELLGQEP